MRILPMGRTAVLIDEIGTEPEAWAAGLRSLQLRGVVDIVPAARTVLIECDDGSSLAAVRERIDDVRPTTVDISADVVEIAVTYDGADLVSVAERCAMSVDDVVAAHSGAAYVVAFCGFAPGFGYLRGLDPRLELPRLATPRMSVPAGSVAIAAEFCAIYPRSSPGGWHLLGTTDAVMFDVDRHPPAMLSPGTRVRFVAR